MSAKFNIVDTVGQSGQQLWFTVGIAVHRCRVVGLGSPVTFKYATSKGVSVFCFLEKRHLQP